MFNSRMRDIRACRVNRYLSASGIDNQIHIFHRHCTKQNFIAQYQSADITKTIPERDFNRPDIRDIHIPTTRHRDLPNRFSIQLELKRNMFGNT